MGFVAPGAMLTRCGARPGDRVYVTGAPGEAMAGLQRLLADPDVPSSHLTRRFLWPEPRVAEGGDLSGLASAAIDLSDGLATDLERIAEASGVRVVIEVEDLPQSEEMKAAFGPEAATALVITGGDDYELAFTMPPDREAELLARAAGWSCSLSRIGHVEAGAGLTFRRDGRPFSPDTTRSWRHFQGDLR
jgi:thiamine-monophosphate kinase